MAFYSDDAIILPPNEQKVDSKEGIRKEIGTMLGAPGLSLHWTPTKVEVAGSGDRPIPRAAMNLPSTMRTANLRLTMEDSGDMGRSRATAVGNALLICGVPISRPLRRRLHASNSAPPFVISTGAQRSGEICGLFLP